MATITTGPFNVTYVNGFSIYETDECPIVADTDTVNSQTITANLSGKKVIIGITVGENSTAAGNFDIQGSVDGTNWILIADIATLSTTAARADVLVDLTAVHLPYYRLTVVSADWFNPTANDIVFRFACD